MSYNFTEPGYWLDRAAEMRSEAQIMRDLGNREIMLRIADDFEKIGRRGNKRPNGRQQLQAKRKAFQNGALA